MSLKKALLIKDGEAMPEASNIFLAVPQPLMARQEKASPCLYAPNWFAVYTTPRHEKRIALHCAQRQIESFLPIYQEVRQWKNRCKVQLDLPLFPSYLFVRIERDERFRVLNIPGVLNILGSGVDLFPIEDEYISSLRIGIETHKITPHPAIDVGDRVRIIAGVMNGKEGILVRKKNDLSVVIKVAMLDRSMAVEVVAEDIELVSSEAARSVTA